MDSHTEEPLRSEEMICSITEEASEDCVEVCAGTPTNVEKVESEGEVEWKSEDDESDTEFAQSASPITFGENSNRSNKRNAGWEMELKRRKWEISYTKKSLAYRNYIKTVPRHTRQEGVHPQTPDITIKGKRSKWPELTKVWRQAIQKFHKIKEEVDEIKVMRENHINRVKKSDEYQRYRRAVRRDARREGFDPQTPDTAKKYDRKYWARQISKWYQALRDWDPDKKETDNKETIVLNKSEEVARIKSSTAYKRYLSAVPRGLRQEGIDPQTPDKNKKCDRKDWKILVERWRIALNEWDNPADDLQTFLEEMNHLSSEDASEDFLFAGTSTKVKEVESEGGFAWESGDDESDTELAVSVPPTSWSPERKRRSDENVLDGSVKTSKSCDQRPDISNILQDQRRDGQISDVKKSAVYQTYVTVVPRHARQAGVHPRTPDKSKKYSQIEFDREITHWRRDLIRFNELEKKADELQARRDGQISDVKKSAVYQTYIKAVPRHARQEGVHPQTPDRSKKYSQIQSDREITRWRTAIIKRNELEKKAGELQARSAPPTSWSQEHQWRSDGNFTPRNDEKVATYPGLQQGPGSDLHLPIPVRVSSVVPPSRTTLDIYGGSAPLTNWSQERRSDGNFTRRNDEKVTTYPGLQQGAGSSAPLTTWSQERRSDWNFTPRNDEKVATYPGLQQVPGSAVPSTNWSQERLSDGNFTPRNDEKVTTYHGLQQGPASSAPLTTWSQERRSDGNFTPRNDEKVTTYPGLQQGAGSSAPPTTWSQERRSDGNFTPRNDEKVTTYPGLQQGPGSSAPLTTWSQERRSEWNFTPRNDEKVATYPGLQQAAGRYTSFYFNPNVS